MYGMTKDGLLTQRRCVACGRQLWARELIDRCRCAKKESRGWLVIPGETRCPVGCLMVAGEE